MNRRPLSPHIKGVLFAIAGYTLWVVTDGCTKVAALAAIPPHEIAVISGLIGMVALLGKTAGARDAVRDLRPKNWRGQIMAALFGLGINLLNVVSLKHLPFVLFFIIAFTAPMMVALLAAAILDEDLTSRKITAVIAGFAGVVIAVNPFAESARLQGDWIGYASAFCAVSCFAANMVLQRRLTCSETPDSIAFTQALVQTVFCAGYLLVSHVPLSLALLLLLCASGLINIIANLCSLAALKNTTAATVAQLHYTQIISGAIIGFFVWHEVPTAHLVLGAVIIILSGLYIAHHMRRAQAAPALKPP